MMINLLMFIGKNIMLYRSFEMTKSKLGKTSISPKHKRYPSKL